MTRLIFILVFATALCVQAFAQNQSSFKGIDNFKAENSSKLEEIIRRQNGLKAADEAKRNALNNENEGAMTSAPLGTLGGASDSQLWRQLRYDNGNIIASSGGNVGAVVMQDGGMSWLEWRQALLRWGGYVLLVTLILLLVFYLLRGRVMIEGELSGRKILRFKQIERFGHWVLAGSFILLGISGLIILSGRFGLIPIIGKDNFAVLAMACKWVHNNVSWAFMLALILIFVLWVKENIPSRIDLRWLAMGGGLFKKGMHPPAKKFNAGQKIVFWAVILLGVSVSVSGLSLLFPFEFSLFATTFEILNFTKIPLLLGLGELPVHLTPQEEMQYSGIWHGIVAFLMMVIILAHIYIGTLGMQGAFEAMDTGEVDETWAQEHHNLWLEEVRSENRG